MTITVEAVYENGVIKPKQLLPLPYWDQEHLEITVHSKSERAKAGAAEATDAARCSFGAIGWRSDHETLLRILDEAEEGE